MYRIKHVLASCLAVAALSTMASSAYAQREGLFRPVGGEARGILKSIDAKAGTIILAYGGGREETASEKTFTMTKNVEICVTSGGGFRAGGVFKEAKLSDLLPGSAVSLALIGEAKEVEAIIAEEPTVRGTLKQVNAEKRTITVAVTGLGDRERRGEAPAEAESTYTLATDAEIAIDDGRGRRLSIHEGKLEDLTQGAVVTVRLTLNKKTATSVLAEGANVFGTVKEINPAKRTITVTTRQGRGDDAGEDRMLAIAKEATVLLDDGKGRRLSIKEGKLADIPVGAMIMARLGADQGFVMTLKAEGPMVQGVLKSVDPEKGAVTIGIFRTRENIEEKTYFLAKDARVNVDGKNATLADLKVGDNGPMIQVRLSLDQKTAQSVISRQPESR